MSSAAVRARLPTFNIGDKVRFNLRKRTFEKDSTANWSEEIFEICEVLQNTQPITYKIKDLAGEVLEGAFYKEQLQKTNQTIYGIERILEKRKRNGKEELLVKWMNYPDKFNSWELADTIMNSRTDIRNDA